MDEQQLLEELENGLFCIGCGAKLQIEEKNKSGYLPFSVLKKQDMDNLLCQRCFRLRHYNEVQSVEVSDNDFKKIVEEIKKVKSGLIVYVLDLFDFNGSRIENLHELVGQKDIFVIANKRDLMPKSLKDHKIKDWLSAQLKKDGITPVDIEIISAEHPQNIDQVISKIETLRNKKNVYLVGMSNVGKSTLLNKILQTKAQINNLITTSKFPGTTLDRIEIPLDDGANLIDLPGIINPKQMIYQVEADVINYLLPKKEIKARTYQLTSNQTIFIAGLARYDFFCEEKKSITAYFENNLKLHRTKMANADDFYAKHKEDLLLPNVKQELLGQELFVDKKCDVVISGLGWIKVPENTKVRVFVPKGVEVSIREAMI